MEQTLLTKTELADRWNISTSTLDRRVREGRVSPVGKFRPIRFSLDEILKIEGTDTSKLSPFERRRLEREKLELEQKIIELEDENRNIKRQLTNVVAEIMPILREVQ